MTVEIWMKETAQPMVHKEAKNAYTKGPMYCVYVGDIVYKYPLDNVWRVRETYY